MCLNPVPGTIYQATNWRGGELGPPVVRSNFFDCLLAWCNQAICPSTRPLIHLYVCTITRTKQKLQSSICDSLIQFLSLDLTMFSHVCCFLVATSIVHLDRFYFLYQILVILVFLILRWSWKMPYISASLVGGHPGTYTSTGTILSHPLTTL